MDGVAIWWADQTACSKQRQQLTAAVSHAFTQAFASNIFNIQVALGLLWFIQVSGEVQGRCMPSDRLGSVGSDQLGSRSCPGVVHVCASGCDESGWWTLVSFSFFQTSVGECQYGTGLQLAWCDGCFMPSGLAPACPSLSGSEAYEASEPGSLIGTVVFTAASVCRAHAHATP